MIGRLLRGPTVAKKAWFIVTSAVKGVADHPANLRYIPRWYLSLLPSRRSLGQGVPWLTFRAIDWLDGWLKPDMRVFEYGSGDSSLFFARRVAKVDSVEHDHAFGHKMEEVIRTRGVANLTLHVIPPEFDGQTLPYSGTTFRSLSRDFTQHSFERYVRTIEAFEDSAFDVILVDGRARASCIVTSEPKLKPTGCLLLDNAERPEYGHLRAWLSRKGYSQTTFRSLGPRNTYVWETVAFSRSPL